MRGAINSRRQGEAPGSQKKAWVERGIVAMSRNFSVLLLNLCAREKVFFTAQRGPEVTGLGDFDFQKFLGESTQRIVGKNCINRI